MEFLSGFESDYHRERVGEFMCCVKMLPLHVYLCFPCVEAEFKTLGEQEKSDNPLNSGFII